MNGIRRLAWLLADYGCRALIRAIDAIGQPRSERGE